MIAKPTIGDIIEVVFLDHAEGPQTLSFRVFGRLAAKTRLNYVIDCWIVRSRERTRIGKNLQFDAACLPHRSLARANRTMW